VRGTEFEFEKDAVYVSSGNVLFGSEGGVEVSVLAGESSSASEGGVVSIPAPAEVAPAKPIQANNEGFTGVDAAPAGGSVGAGIFSPGEAGKPQSASAVLTGFDW
jgi:hypothetical protein